MWHRKQISLYQDWVLYNPDIDVVKVSPLINANDIMAIRLKVDEYSRMPINTGILILTNSCHR